MFYTPDSEGWVESKCESETHCYVNLGIEIPECVRSMNAWGDGLCIVCDRGEYKRQQQGIARDARNGLREYGERWEYGSRVANLTLFDK